MEKQLNERAFLWKKKGYNLETEHIYVVFFMSLFLALNIMSPNMEALIMSLCSLYPIAVWIRHRMLPLLPCLFVYLMLYLVLFAFLTSSGGSLHYFVSELKILMLFTLPFFFYYLMKEVDYRLIIKSFFQFFSGLVALTTVYGYLSFNEFRYTGFFDHSIYISVCLVLFMSYLYDDLNWKWKLVTLLNVCMLGSSNGLLIYLLVFLIKGSLSIWLKIFPSVIGSFYIYWYITVFRGREIVDGGFWEVDRVLLITSLNRYTVEHFSLLNYFFGFGIGRPLDKFMIIPRVTNDEVNGFIKWFNDFSSQGVYPYSFHNEFTRVFYNFGLIGLVLVFYYLYSHLDKTTFFILLIACITNTIIYSTVGLFTLALIIAVAMLEKEKKLYTPKALKFIKFHSD